MRRELKDRVKESKGGKTLLEADKALTDAERAADKIADLLDEGRPRG